MRTHTLCVSALAALLLLPAAPAQTPAKPWPIRAVIVTTFEIGNDTGDIPGEFQFWVEREHLTESLPFPGGPIGPGSPHAIRANSDHTVLAIVSGTTLINATASMMALGLDPRFDLTHAYILINGIAGIDPRVGSIGSAAWANFVINDVARQIDSREAPADWPYGIFPSGALRPAPDALPTTTWTRSNLYVLNPKLTAWAFARTKDLNLGDDPTVAAFRASFTNYPAARRPPFVLIGDTFASDTYWHGRILTQYARDWVRLYTQGKGVFATTEMEDAGFMNAIERLNAMHRLDADRVLDCARPAITRSLARATPPSSPLLPPTSARASPSNPPISAAAPCSTASSLTGTSPTPTSPPTDPLFNIRIHETPSSPRNNPAAGWYTQRCTHES